MEDESDESQPHGLPTVIVFLLCLALAIALIIIFVPALLRGSDTIIGLVDSGVGTNTYSAIPKGEKVEYTHNLVTQPSINVNKDYFAKNIPSSVRRQGIIDRVVLRYSGTDAALKVIEVFQNEKDRSTHYLIDRDGTTYYLVDELRKAWHASCCPDSNKKCCNAKSCPVCADDSWVTINDRAIGILLVNTGEENDAYPEAQYEALTNLLNDINSRRALLTIDNSHIIAYYQVVKGGCGPTKIFDWSQIGLEGHVTAEQLGIKC